MKIGKLIDGNEQRDAIHIAIAPVIANELLRPGQHVGLIDKNRIGTCDPNCGIVDPYLTTSVRPGQKCWLFLYSDTVTSLRHEWVHPAFSDKEASIIWLTAFAGKFELTYDALMEAAGDWQNHGSYCHLHHTTPDEAYTQRQEMWYHYEVVTGERVPDKDEIFFTCSC